MPMSGKKILMWGLIASAILIGFMAFSRDAVSKHIGGCYDVEEVDKVGVKNGAKLAEEIPTDRVAAWLEMFNNTGDPTNIQGDQVRIYENPNGFVIAVFTRGVSCAGIVASKKFMEEFNRKWLGTNS